MNAESYARGYVAHWHRLRTAARRWVETTARDGAFRHGRRDAIAGRVDRSLYCTDGDYRAGVKSWTT